MNDPNVGQKPFPVMSMPIKFASRVSKKGAKQEQIERVYQVYSGNLETGRPDLSLRFVEQTSFDLDKVSHLCVMNWIKVCDAV